MTQYRHGYRNVDSRYPPMWELSSQPAARWHAAGDGPVQYLADTPDGAWAEFLRHEEITDPADLAGVLRSLWAVEVPTAHLDSAHDATGAPIDLLGTLNSYPQCQAYARAVRDVGAETLVAPSAALHAGGARGQVVDGTLVEAKSMDGMVWVLFGVRSELRCWRVVERGAPDARVLSLVRPLVGRRPRVA